MHRSRGRQGQFECNRRAVELLTEFADSSEIAFAHPLQHEAIRCKKSQARMVVGRCLSRSEGLDPGAELLRRQFAFKSRQAEGPEIVGHGEFEMRFSQGSRNAPSTAGIVTRGRGGQIVVDVSRTYGDASCNRRSPLLSGRELERVILPSKGTLIHSALEKIFLTNMGLCNQMLRLTLTGEHHNETHLPAFRRPSQAHPRLPRPDEDSWRSRRDPRTSRQGPSPSRRLK